MHRMRQCAGRHPERSNIAGNVERLNCILRVVFVRCVAQSAHLNVHLAIVLVSSLLVESTHTEDCGWLQVSSVPHHQAVGSVPETLGKSQVRTRPPVPFFLYAEMEGSARVGPSIVTIVQIVQPSPVARNSANPPLVSAELKRVCRRELQRSYALDN